MLEDFRKVIESAGLRPSEIISDGNLHRCPVEGGKRGAKDAAYIAYLDFPPTIWFQNFRTGETGTWSPKKQHALSEAERRKVNIRIKADREARQVEQSRHWTEGAAKAQAMLDQAEPCQVHPYLDAKGVGPCAGLKVGRDDHLLVPVLGPNGQTQSLQTITPDGVKRFLTGGKTSGGFFVIGHDKQSPLAICEGLATGLSIHEATGYTTLVAFNAGNLKPVSRLARKLHPDRQIVLCGDDDCQTRGNPGRIKATVAAQQAGAKLAMPVFEDDQPGSDFNDLHQAEGLEAVKMHIENASEPEPIPGMDFEQVYQVQSPAERETLPPLPSFPIEVLPSFLAAYVSKAARVFAVPVEVPATALLSLASACIGRKRSIAIKSSWREHANLFLGLVARSGVGKTPCTSAIFNSVYRLEKKWFEDWQQASLEYMELWAQYESALRRKPNEGNPPPKCPEPPKRTQLLIDDATIESVADALDDNPRGVLWHRDELSGLLQDLDKYSKESEGTKSRLLSAYDSKLWKINRKTQGKSLFIPHACLGIFGGVQPGVLSNLFSSEDRLSGLLPRFLFVLVRPSNAATWTDEFISNEERQGFDCVIERILSLKFGAEEEPVNLTVRQSGKQTYVNWFNSLAWEQWAGTEYVEARSAKLKGQALRLALILHLLDWAAEGGEEGTEPDTVGAATMEKALTLADWFNLHQEQAWQLILGDENAPDKRPQDCDPLDLKVARAIVSLEVEIENGRLPVGKIVEEINREIPEDYKISAAKIGKSCTRLGLASQKSGGTRFRLVGPDLLAGIKQLFAGTYPETPAPPVPPAPNVAKLDSYLDFNPPHQLSHPSHAAQVRGGGLGTGGTGADSTAPHIDSCNYSNKDGWDGWDGLMWGSNQQNGPTKDSKSRIFDHEVEI